MIERCHKNRSAIEKLSKKKNKKIRARPLPSLQLLPLPSFLFVVHLFLVFHPPPLSLDRRPARDPFDFVFIFVFIFGFFFSFRLSFFPPFRDVDLERQNLWIDFAFSFFANLESSASRIEVAIFNSLLNSFGVAFDRISLAIGLENRFFCVCVCVLG